MPDMERGELMGDLAVERNRSSTLWENLQEAWKKLQALGYCIECLELEVDCKCHQSENE